MTFYRDDRLFTDIIHKEVAMKEIYPLFSWDEFGMDEKELNRIDMDEGIDYVMIDKSGIKHTVQERFREYKYSIYSDFTLRYRRDQNSMEERHESEFYKIKAEYMVYGIINGSKGQTINHTKEISFVKFAVVDLRKLFSEIRAGNIVLDKTIRRPQIIGGKLHAAVNNNVDGSSSFVAFDIRALRTLFGPNIILAQKGFF